MGRDDRRTEGSFFYKVVMSKLVCCGFPYGLTYFSDGVSVDGGGAGEDQCGAHLDVHFSGAVNGRPARCKEKEHYYR